MKNLITRTLTGIVYVALIVGAVLAGGWWIVALLALFSALAMNEFYGLANREGESVLTRVIDIVGGLLLTLGLAFASTSAWLNGVVLLLAYPGYMVVRLVWQLYAHEKSPLSNLAYSYMGHIYIALPLGLASVYYAYPCGTALLLAMFIMIWLSDTGAYLVGSAIGKHKMIPRISPGKSWEGFIGGVLFATLSGLVFKYGFGEYYTSISALGLCGMGFIVSIFATWGDLVESLIKRTLGVKDSGKLLPGHGGILDRIDSLLLVAPASVIYLAIVVMM